MLNKLTAIRIFLLVTVGTVSSRSLYSSCPTDAFIQPCSCVFFSHMEVICSKVEHKETLFVPFDYLQLYSIDKLLMSEVGFTVPNGLYDGMDIYYMKITSSYYKVSGTGSTFQGLENKMQYLEFVKSDLDFGNTTLAGIKDLKEIVFYECDLTKLSRHSFDGIQALSTLKIKKSIMPSNEHLEKGFIFGMRNVKEIIWNENQGPLTLKRSYFPSPEAECLENLDLSYNSIEVLPDDMFTGMPKLKTIQLYGNKIKELKENVWTPIWRSITTVGLEDNQIKCDGSLIWMFERAFPPRFNAHCETPQELHDSLIRGLQKSDIEKYLK